MPAQVLVILGLKEASDGPTPSPLQTPPPASLALVVVCENGSKQVQVRTGREEMGQDLCGQEGGMRTAGELRVNIVCLKKQKHTYIYIKYRLTRNNNKSFPRNQQRAEVEQKQQRTFRKVTYLGEDLARRSDLSQGQSSGGAQCWLRMLRGGARSLLKRLRQAQKAGPRRSPGGEGGEGAPVGSDPIPGEAGLPQGQGLQQVEIVTLARGPSAPPTHN